MPLLCMSFHVNKYYYIIIKNVAQLKSRATGKSRRWDIAQLECRATGLSRRWDVAQMGYRPIEMSRIWKVAQMGCRAIEMSRLWDMRKKCRANDVNPFIGASVGAARRSSLVTWVAYNWHSYGTRKKQNWSIIRSRYNYWGTWNDRTLC